MINNCEECIENGTICTLCKENYLLSSDSTSCVSNCSGEIDTYPNITSTPYQCKKCIEAIDYCIKCENSSYCIEC